MADYINLDTLIAIMLAVSLSAAAGFRVFVPLLVLSGAAVIGHVDLPADFDWIETQPALILFAAACLLEIGGYYIPWVDHLLDLVSTPAAIIAGTVMTASLAPEMNPLVQWTLALAAGGGTAGVTKGLMNIFRATSTATSGGIANPIFSTFELIAAAGLSVLALTVPLAAGLAVMLILTIAIRQLWRLAARFQPSATPEPPVS
ncbi:MAG: DUF4126 domain-containing protein [Drouetiella hepatica Uher 2000/2452]|jgi:hypothetical protein|uniref:DUF4126 domain-containing protein n=1 Tax=Drouetiella hepatica Uher 2000/2452 TaxID=904376 RepID=A0A951UKW5_9CYAN|nr:DUF4126 domain-containing protein [Drouetiella hepatica Uher 2000/2452]